MLNILIWDLILVIAIITSTFLHEIGHGLSHLLCGGKISTGFNKVGNYDKKPTNDDFRSDFEFNQPLIDFGVPITFLLALVSLVFLNYVDNIILIIVFSAFAYSNSLLRLIPCIHSIFGFMKNREFSLEDEIGIGKSLYEKFNLKGLLIIPLILSLTISVLFLNLSIRYIDTFLKDFIILNRFFVLNSIIIFIVSFNILDILDKKFRINWG